MSVQWIVIPKWDDFQHPDAARSRTLPWIKSWTRLLSDDNYLKLTAGERAALHGIWLEYARSHCQLPIKLEHVTGSSPARDEFVTSSLARRLSLRVTHKTIMRLNHAGFIHFSASKPASNVASTPASTEEKRVRTPRPPTGEKHKLACRYCTQTFTNERLRGEHEQGQHVLWGDKPHTPIEEGS